MNELVIISGKGGTGKTSITASLAVLAGTAVVADCDVDAADLHLVLAPEVQRREAFRSGHTASVRADDCNGCGTCLELCRFDALRWETRADGGRVAAVAPGACEGCGLCVRYCPQYAIDFEECTCGEWYVSRTRCGPLVHAALAPAAENSGKLVSVVREQARAVAAAQGRELILIDGAPGIGCPVIASIAGVRLALVVTEPTVSGLHDMERITQVTGHFKVPTCICINKWDLHAPTAERITTWASERGLPVVGRVRYDRAVTQAQMRGQALVELTTAGAAEDVRALWQALGERMRRAAEPTGGGAVAAAAAPGRSAE